MLLYEIKRQVCWENDREKLFLKKLKKKPPNKKIVVFFRYLSDCSVTNNYTLDWLHCFWNKKTTKNCQWNVLKGDERWKQTKLENEKNQHKKKKIQLMKKKIFFSRKFHVVKQKSEREIIDRNQHPNKINKSMYWNESKSLSIDSKKY